MLHKRWPTTAATDKPGNPATRPTKVGESFDIRYDRESRIRKESKGLSLISTNMKIAGDHVVSKTLNVILPLVGIGLMLAYDYCDTSCVYLRGSFFGIDLKWVGIIYMGILLLSALRWKDCASPLPGHLRTVLMSAAVGVEFYLIGWQVAKDTYCPFCLAFSACIFILFGINYRSMNRWIMVASVFAGLLGFTLFFDGQVGPRFDL